MKSFNKFNKASLFLENGLIFRGKRIGVEGNVFGEIIFNTAMTGYQEIISDPSYSNQIIMFTSSHIGNVGVNPVDQESEVIWATGIILKSLSDYYSSWRATDSLENYLIKNKVVGIAEIDTRALTNVLRLHGSLWGCISSETMYPKEVLHKIQIQKKLRDPLKKNLSNVPYEFKGRNKYRILIYDFGIKKSIISALSAIGCDVILVPHNTDYRSSLAFNPDGILLSNGPGDPREYKQAIETTKIFLQMKIPILGICLGHQILGLASGAMIYKMKYGHHGANHPIYDVREKKVCISSQNHNFAISEIIDNNDLIITHSSLVDGSVQGVKHRFGVAIGFQGHPEGSPGPHDLSFVFQQFIEILDQKKHSLKEKIYA